MTIFPGSLSMKSLTRQHGRKGFFPCLLLAAALFALSAAAWSADDPFAGEDIESDAIAERPKDAAPQTEKSNPLSAVTPGMPSLYFRDRRGVDVPLIDDKGDVIYQRPDEKSPEEMNEEDFYKTMTPAEKVLLTTPPETGPEFIEAAVLISRVGRPYFAKLLAQKGLEAAGEPEAYAAMVDRLGEDKLIAFGHNPVIGETADQVVRKSLDEAKKAWRDPARIRDAFERAAAKSPETRAAALTDLKRGYPDAFDFLLQKLESGDEAEQQLATQILAQGGIFAAEGLLARVRHCDEDELRRLALVLDESESLPELTPLLVRYYDENTSPELRELLGQVVMGQVGKIPDPEESAARALVRGLPYYEGKIALPNVVGGEYPIWTENEDGQIVWQMVPTETAKRILAAQELRDAYTLNPDHPRIRNLALVAVAEMLTCRDGLDAPPNTGEFTQIFPDLTAADCENAVDFAIRTGHTKGGIIPVTLLEQIGDTSLFAGENGPSTLVRAAVSGDRRLQFAALKTIAALNPAASYPGSSGVIDSLIWFSTSLGKRHAIVASPDMETISQIGSYISEGDIFTTPAGTGRDIITKAQADADIEFVVALSNVKKPDLRTVAETLAADYRTNDIPILVVYEDETRKDQALRYGEGEPNVMISVIPFDKESGPRLIGELYAKTDPRQVPADVRFGYAKEAITILTHLRETCPNVYQFENAEGLALRYLATPALTKEGIAFAMTVPEKSVQANLSLLTFDGRFDQNTRRRYLDALTEHIGRYGLLLRGPDILQIFSGPWPGDSGENRKAFFRLISENTEEKGEIALSIPSVHIQNLLGDLAADSSLSQEEREEAIGLFRRHLEKYGLLLDRPDVQRLYDQYNATENEPELEQRLTGEILEAIEAWQAGHLGLK